MLCKVIIILGLLLLVILTTNGRQCSTCPKERPICCRDGSCCPANRPNCCGGGHCCPTNYNICSENGNCCPSYHRFYVDNRCCMRTSYFNNICSEPVLGSVDVFEKLNRTETDENSEGAEPIRTEPSHK